MTLGDLQPNEDFVSSAITFMTSGGATPRVDFNGSKVAARYVYWTADDGAEDGAGWYLEDDEDATVNQNAVNIPFGTGFLVFRDAGEANANVTFAGAVSTEPTTKSFATSSYIFLRKLCKIFLLCNNSFLRRIHSNKQGRVYLFGAQ